MAKKVMLALLMILATVSGQAQRYQPLDRQEPINIKDGKIYFRSDTLQLNDNTIFVDGHLSEAEAVKLPHTYNSIQKALADIKVEDNTTIYIAPWVYWIDDPNDTTIKKGANGLPPIGLTVRCKSLHIIGLTGDAMNVVLAAQRGQTMGADGNFTMLNFITEHLKVENITLGNYLNVDLEFPLNHNLNTKRKSNNIVQAQLAFQQGKTLEAENCRFVSRLNLCPITGATTANYSKCHFESTDDALNGEATYTDCDFDFYSSKPIYQTSGDGATFIGCTFNVKHRGNQYITKHTSRARLINCKFILPDNNYVGWTPYPERWLRCEQYHVTNQQGKEIVMGCKTPENTVDFTAMGHTPTGYLQLNTHSASIQTGSDGITLKAHNTNDVYAKTKWNIEAGYEKYIRIDTTRNGECVIIADNKSDETVNFCINVSTDDGLQQACLLTVAPKPLNAPTFSKGPKIKVKDGMATVEYSLSRQDKTDESHVEWWVEDKGEKYVISISRGSAVRTYRLNHDDTNKKLTARVWPKYKGSMMGEMKESKAYTVKEKDAKTTVSENIETDFHDFPTYNSPTIKNGGWSIDGHKPADCNEWDWTVDSLTTYWKYGESNNGCVGPGLCQTAQGARLIYTPKSDQQYGDMAVTLLVDPQKTAGQGFSSARGQYMDIGIKMDTRHLDGYALRIIRTKKHSGAVDFLLMEYHDGKATPISQAVTSTCYRTGCTINISLKGNTLKASASTTSQQPDSSLAKKVNLEATVAPSTYGGLLIQHTGTTGEGQSMLHHLRIEYGK